MVEPKCTPRKQKTTHSTTSIPATPCGEKNPKPKQRPTSAGKIRCLKGGMSQKHTPFKQITGQGVKTKEVGTQ